MLDWFDGNVHSGRFFGLYAGTVRAVRKDGSLDVSVPSVFDAVSPDAFAVARPCFPYGHFFVPSVGDQVWVAFENGDPAAAVWLGIWYAEGKAPAEPSERRVIRSAAGHLVVLDDTEGEEKVTVADKSGNRIELGKNGLTIKSAGKLTIDASGQEVEILAKSVDIKGA